MNIITPPKIGILNLQNAPEPVQQSERIYKVPSNQISVPTVGKELKSGDSLPPNKKRVPLKKGKLSY
jgi:hypothetical protein